LITYIKTETFDANNSFPFRLSDDLIFHANKFAEQLIRFSLIFYKDSFNKLTYNRKKMRQQQNTEFRLFVQVSTSLFDRFWFLAKKKKFFQHHNLSPVVETKKANIIFKSNLIFSSSYFKSYFRNQLGNQCVTFGHTYRNSLFCSEQFSIWISYYVL